jgi:hypothetical protein
VTPDISDVHVGFIVQCNKSMKNIQYRSLKQNIGVVVNSIDSQKGAVVLQWQ